jgi:hypothetical protein
LPPFGSLTCLLQTCQSHHPGNFARQN